MKVLLIEDSDLKARQVRAYLASEFPEAVTRLARSVTSGRRAILEARPDLVLLDMSLPVFDVDASEAGFKHLAYGGLDILELLDRGTEITPVIVLTAFDRFGDRADAKTLAQLDDELRRDFPTFYLGRVSYSSASDRWQSELAALIRTAKQLLGRSHDEG